jgi:hypothetical protein
METGKSNGDRNMAITTKVISDKELNRCYDLYQQAKDCKNSQEIAQAVKENPEQYNLDAERETLRQMGYSKDCFGYSLYNRWVGQQNPIEKIL